MTVRARRRIEQAHLVVHDPGVSESILRLVPEGADCFCVGRPVPRGLVPILLRAARAAWHVVLLSSGEAFATGWGKSLLRRLERAGAEFECLPTLPLALAAVAAAGVAAPVREAVPDLTAFAVPGRRGGLPALMAATLSGSELAELSDSLAHQGVPMTTPAVAVRAPLTPRQEVQRADLRRIAAAARAPGETLTVVFGTLAEPAPAWGAWARLPLIGRRVVVTRAAEPSDALGRMLKERGADAVAFPTMAIVPPRNPRALDRALLSLRDYHWLIFTSANGVRRFFARLAERGDDLRAVGHLRLAAIGPGTADALAEWRLRPDVVPDEYVAESLAVALARAGVRGMRILLPRAREAREVLPALLAREGARVDVVEAYRAVPVRHRRAEVRRALADADVLTFASAQTARNFVAVAKSADPTLLRRLRRHAVVASIGPITSYALRQAGLPANAEARAYTIPGLVEAVVEACAPARG